MFENIDLTAIQKELTPKPDRSFHNIEHIVEQICPIDLNHKLSDVEEDPILIEPLSQQNCVDLNSDGGDAIVKHANEGEASNDDDPPNHNCGNESIEIDVSHIFMTDEVSICFVYFVGV